MSEKSGKSSASTLQVLMRQRQQALLEELAEKKGVSKSYIIRECMRRAIEKYNYLLDD